MWPMLQHSATSCLSFSLSRHRFANSSVIALAIIGLSLFFAFVVERLFFSHAGNVISIAFFNFCGISVTKVTPYLCLNGPSLLGDERDIADGPRQCADLRDLGLLPHRRLAGAALSSPLQHPSSLALLGLARSSPGGRLRGPALRSACLCRVSLSGLRNLCV